MKIVGNITFGVTFVLKVEALFAFKYGLIWSKRLDLSNIRHIFGECNTVADAIASHGHQLSNICVWFHHVPHLVARKMLFDNRSLEISRRLSLQFPSMLNKETV